MGGNEAVKEEKEWCRDRRERRRKKKTKMVLGSKVRW